MTKTNILQMIRSVLLSFRHSQKGLTSLPLKMPTSTQQSQQPAFS